MPDAQDWISFGCEADVREKGSIAQVVGDREIVLLIAGGRLVAIQRKCPHEGANLDEGRIFGDKVIKCPLHGFVFDLVTGKGLNCPTLQISTYETKIENGEVFVKRS
jgi:nitrite reductase/ring-hydroxylating ferredoxin subunit